MRHFSIIVGLVLTLGACASSGATGDQPDRDVLTQIQLAETGQTNAHDAVRSLQPRWLRGGMTIYVDGAVAAGGRNEGGAVEGGNRGGLASVVGARGRGGNEGAEYLRTLTVTSVREMRYLDPRVASIKYGMGMGVVIEVTTVR